MHKLIDKFGNTTCSLLPSAVVILAAKSATANGFS